MLSWFHAAEEEQALLTTSDRATVLQAQETFRAVDAILQDV